MSESFPKQEQKEAPEDKEKLEYITMLNELLYQRYSEPVFLSREERKIYKNGTPEQQDLYNKYENGKYRGAWFTGVFGAVELALSTLETRKDVSQEEISNLIKEREELEDEYIKGKQAVMDGKIEKFIITKDMVDRADKLIKKVLDKLNK